MVCVVDGAIPSVGDCWLLSALASMAEYPEAVRNIFVQNEHSPRHKYRVKMWNIKTKTWLHVSVDDYIPVKKGTSTGSPAVTCTHDGCPGTYTPYFTDPQGLELWVFLVEKAFAKYHGG
jgi:calpain-15